MRSLAHRTAILGAAVLVGTGLALTACSGSGSGSGGGSGSATSGTVTIWSSVDPPIQAGLTKELESELAAKGDKIKITWSDVTNINQVIITKIQAGGLPDIAYIPQPGVVKQMVALGAAKPMNSVVDMSALEKDLVPGVLQTGEVNGQLYGLLGSANVKGLIWVNKPLWAKAGWKIPTTIAGLEALETQMKAKDPTIAPFCMGVQSTGSSGWPATDWFSTLMMKDYGPTAYNDWVNHTIKFSSAQLENVASQFSQILFAPGNVYGGRSSIDSNNFGTAGNGLFTSSTSPTAKCWMYMQGSFITGFFPASVQANLDKDVGVFEFPPLTAGGQDPIEGGGDSITMLDTNPATETVVKLLSQASIGDDAAPTSTFISPYETFNSALYPSATTKQVVALMKGTSSFLFGAGDAMPAAVGSGAFWSQMVAWIGNQDSISTALSTIDAAWPTSS